MSAPVLSLAGFFSIPAKEYEHFTITYTTAKTLTALVVAICAGVILAALYNFYIRRVPGGVVRLLLSRDALSPEKALSAEELGLLDKPFALWELLRGVSLRHTVCAVTESATAAEEAKAPSDAEAQTEELVPDADAAQAMEAPDADAAKEAEKTPPAEELAFDAQTRFYIPEDKRYRAEGRFAEEGNGPVGLAITCALSLVLGFALIKLIPVVLTLVDNFL